VLCKLKNLRCKLANVSFVFPVLYIEGISKKCLRLCCQDYKGCPLLLQDLGNQPELARAMSHCPVKTTTDYTMATMQGLLHTSQLEPISY